jgi:hypothetical protein
MATTENGKPRSNQVHFILQGKGGVGKSLVSAILGQYFHARKANLWAAAQHSGYFGAILYIVPLYGPP